MAKRTSRTDELFELLRARGLRKNVAKVLSEAAATGRGASGSSQNAARKIIGDLRAVADDLESRITGKDSKRSEAAKKAARTRARKASARSAAAKKGAATRRAASGTSKAKSTAKRTATTAKRKAAAKR